jgi:hypothetical protein
MMKKFVYFGWMLLYLCSTADASPLQSASRYTQQIAQIFSNNSLQLTNLNQAKLPAPYRYLLTQPLMTKGMKTYYQRNPIIKVLYSQHDNRHHTYSRVITMLVDKDKRRNSPELAQKKKEIITTELAYITINLDALPKKMITEIFNTTVPFGQLLTKNNIKTGTKGRSYFLTGCNKIMKPFLECEINETLYGRKNTIYRKDNQKWVAHVIEILPAMEKR